MPYPGPLESETCREKVVPALLAAGWRPEQIREQMPITDGRIVPTRGRERRARPLVADYVLERSPGLAVAVVEAKRSHRNAADGLQQAMRYAQMLRVPLAYATNGEEIIEHDFATGAQAHGARFPSPDEAWLRFTSGGQIASGDVEAALEAPFSRSLRNPDGTVKTARYYQRVAVHEALKDIVGGRRRVLLTLATGTGKTFVAMQIVWKLWHVGWKAPRNPRVLYLADRNILVDQPIAREFRPVFGDAVHKLGADASTSREIYFALYQRLADTPDGLGLFRDFPRDFFDLVIVDECHRGSAADGSSWRKILDWFHPAVQLGMTATPRRADNSDTYEYFGNPAYEYSLAQGIEDGFLAPYRVRRVVLSPDAFGWAPDQQQLDRFGREIPPGLYRTPDFERVVSLLARTDAAARHLTRYLRATDRMGKTIVFCVDAEHAEQMRAALHRENGDLTRQYPHYVARIVGAEGDVGLEHLGDFADPESPTPVIATTSQMLSTGVDMPTVRTIVLFKPIGSLVEFKQIIGRGTRLYTDADKLSFEIIDYSGATQLFHDPEFDGLPERVVVEHVDEHGDDVPLPHVAEPLPRPPVGVPPDDGGLPPARVIRKFYVDEGEAHVTAEGFYLPAPDSGRLVLVEYSEYVVGVVRTLFGTASELHAQWRTQAGRDRVVEELASRGISLDELADRTQAADLDALDLLVHLAWNRPALSRRQRADRIRRERADFFDGFADDARAVLVALLDKYAEHGIEELDDLKVLETSPLALLGTPVEIAARFGGPAALRDAVLGMQELVYG